MSRSSLFLIAFLGIFLSAASFQAWEKNPQMPSASPWETLLPHPLEANTLLAASQNTVYANRPEHDRSWKKFAALSSPAFAIKKMRYFPQTPDSVFVLTERQLFKTSLKTGRQELVYELPRLKEKITDFVVSPGEPSRWFLGTLSGVLESRNGGLSWRLFTPIPKEPVCFLRFASQRFFVAQTDRLLVSENLSGFQKAFSLSHFKEEEPLVPLTDDPSVEANSQVQGDACFLRELVSNAGGTTLWLATSRGVFENNLSKNSSWTEISSTGLLSKDIRFLIYEEQKQLLLAASSHRIFQRSQKKNSWREIPFSLAGDSVRGLSSDSNQLYVITASGLLSHPLLPDDIQVGPLSFLSPDQKQHFQNLLELEPSALEIQRAVTRFANAENSKTKLWQAESRLRALFPTVSVGKDLSRDNNIDIDRGSTSDPDRFIQGPEDISRDWSVNVGWDLGDFVFSSSQTSIDSREKMMVELRHDLTSEATRLYYERRRLQTEFLFLPADSEEEHLNRLLRIEELTALLDSMTGGLMSQRLERLYRESPELQEVWLWHDTNQHK